ncbi:MAG: ABC transporter ATP-binding protein [Verrucomicrobia bacterium]|nr:ABC transporter ATP-binding protein [Verrucomicrobiota bacterium]
MFLALEHVSLEIQPGEFITLLGPSGCGKTTALRMISGLDTPTEGQVFIDGADITALPPYRRNVNQVFQSYALFPHLNVGDNIEFGLTMQKVEPAERKRRMLEVLELVSLQDMEARKPDQLSGGQRQRVALARALVCRPKVLLLDEPLSALDAKLRQNMQLELKNLQAKLGITFVFVTHDQEEALVMSDRIALMNMGKIEQIGTVDDLYYHPKTHFVADFIGETNLFPCEISGRTADHVIVKIGDRHELKIPPLSVSPDTQEVLLSIRPEKVQLQHKPMKGENCYPAVVLEEIFKGPADELVLGLEPSAQGTYPIRLHSLVPNFGTDKQIIHRGDKVFARIHPDDIVVVEEKSA